MRVFIALYLIVVNVFCKDARPTQSRVVRMDECPELGYFIARESQTNALGTGDCELCFCKGADTAICWKREPWKCSPEYAISRRYRSDRVVKKNKRKARSPISFSELFFRDAAKEVFNKQSPVECQPFESSYSEGCPPDDWCIGCTVCDCNANGHWDCHVLSFCGNMNSRNSTSKKRHRHSHRHTRKKQQQKAKNAHPTVTANNVDKKKNKPLSINKKPVMNVKSAGEKVKPNNSKHKLISTRQVKPTQTTTKKPLGRIMKRQSKNLITVKPSVTEVRTVKVVDNKTAKVVKMVIQKVFARIGQRIKDVLQNNLTIDSSTNCAQTLQEENTTQGQLVGSPRGIIKIKRTTKRPFKKPVFKNFKKRSKRYTLVNGLKDSRSKRSNTSKTPFNNSTKVEEFTNSSITKNLTIQDINNLHTTTNNNSHTNYYEYTVVSTEMINTTINSESFVANTNKNVNNKSHHIKTSGISTTSVYTTQSNQQSETSTSYQPNNIKEKYFQFVPEITTTKENLNNNMSLFNHVNEHLITALKTEVKPSTYNNIKENSNSNINFRMFMTKILSMFFKKGQEKIQNNTKVMKSGKIKERKKNDPKESQNIMIQSICENFEACEVDESNIISLQSKIKKLNRDISEIMDTVVIIKRLLNKFALTSENNSTNKSYMEPPQKKLKNNMLILSGIIHKNLGQNLVHSDQIDAVESLKYNTKLFVRKLTRFATEVKKTMRNLENKSNHEKLIGQSSRDKSFIINKPQQREEIKNAQNKNPLKKLKHLLVKYNFIQNKFMNKIYNLLNEMRIKRKINSTDNHSNKSIVKYKGDLASEEYAKKIVDNLKIFKKIAGKIGLSKNRTKRQASEDNEDAIDYLLALLEFVVTQNYTISDVLDDDDSLDMLIEAIKNTPDVKPTSHKNVVDTKPHKSKMSQEIQHDRQTEAAIQNYVFGAPNSKVAEVTTGTESEEIPVDRYTKTKRVKPVHKEESSIISPIVNAEPTMVADIINENNEKEKKHSVFRVSNVDNSSLKDRNSEQVEENPDSNNDTSRATDDKDVSLQKLNEDAISSRIGIPWVEESQDDSTEITTKSTRIHDVDSSVTSSTEATKVKVKLAGDPTGTSSMSGEVVSNPALATEQSRLDAEELMNKKQMDLLNSLDYGITDKTDDENPDDRMSNDIHFFY